MSVAKGIKEFRKARPPHMSSREADRIWRQCKSKVRYVSSSEVDWPSQKNRRLYRCEHCDGLHLTKAR